MLQELADENDNNQNLKMNNSKTKVKTENDISIFVNNTQRMLKATSTLDRDTAPETKTKTSMFNEESQPDKKHSPSTATSSKVTLEHA